MSAPTKTRRGTTNRNERGSSYSRRSRRAWLVATFGDGKTVLCALGCGTLLTRATVTADRFPVRGCDGGSYRRGNIRPACGPCNSADGGRVSGERRRAASA